MRAVLLLPALALAGCLNIEPPPPSISRATSDEVVIYSAVRDDFAAGEKAMGACKVHGRQAMLVESYRTGLGDEVKYLFTCVERE